MWGGFSQRMAFAVVALGSFAGCAVQPDANRQALNPQGEERVVYGEDDRVDLYEVTDPVLRKLADSTVVLISGNDLTDQGTGFTKVKGVHYGKQMNLCADEPFRNQEFAGFCSGFLVAEDIIVTAGHCITNQTGCRETRFVFGYAYKDKDQAPTNVLSEDVYRCDEILKTQAPSGGADFAVIRLDRPVRNHEPLKLQTAAQPTVGTDLTIIGHPVGLPTKVAPGAKVRGLTNRGYFVATTDSYGGNSGSAVFNSDTGEVEGILVRGEQDFELKNGCMKTKYCDEDACRGEDVTFISEVLPFLPNADQSQPAQPASQPTVFDSQRALRIPDGVSRGVEAALRVSEAPKGRRVFIAVDIEHSYRGDLALSVIAPDGREVVLKNPSNDSTHDLRGVFGSDFEPVESLDSLSDVNQAGTWRLKIADVARLDSGVLRRWSVVFH